MCEICWKFQDEFWCFFFFLTGYSCFSPIVIFFLFLTIFEQRNKLLILWKRRWKIAPSSIEKFYTIFSTSPKQIGCHLESFTKIVNLLKIKLNVHSKYFKQLDWHTDFPVDFPLNFYTEFPYRYCGIYRNW